MRKIELLILSQNSGTPLWVQMQKFDMPKFLEIVKTQAYADGEELFALEDKLEHIYFLQHGQVRTYTLSTSGQIDIKQVYSSGDIFGCVFKDMGLQPMGAEAIGDVVICSITDFEFKQLMQACPDTCIGMFQYVAQHRNEQVGQLKKMLQGNAYQRVIRTLLIFGQRLGFGRNECFTLYPYFTHGDIASLAGLQRTTVSEIISQLRKDEIIVGKGRRICVRRAQALNALKGVH